MRHLSWPLPALLVWAAAWLAYGAVSNASERWLSTQGATVLAVTTATLLGAAGALAGSTPWRRLFIGLGFPLSLAASGAAALPAWAWLLPAGLCLLVYPPRAWRDAPVFPTPRGALAQLAGAAPLADGARVLDAGCGLGDGLIALRCAYPKAALEGVELSLPVAAWCTLRGRLRGLGARVRRGDLWRPGAWAGCAMVYCFQRPESMPRMADKARAELAPGAWLVSLEFPLPASALHGFAPPVVLPAARTVYAYQRRA